MTEEGELIHCSNGEPMNANVWTIFVDRLIVNLNETKMKNENLYGWFDVSSKVHSLVSLLFVHFFQLDHLTDERTWTRQYLELNPITNTLTLHSNQVRPSHLSRKALNWLSRLTLQPILLLCPHIYIHLLLSSHVELSVARMISSSTVPQFSTVETLFLPGTLESPSFFLFGNDSLYFSVFARPTMFSNRCLWRIHVMSWFLPSINPMAVVHLYMCLHRRASSRHQPNAFLHYFLPPIQRSLLIPHRSLVTFKSSHLIPSIES